MEIKVNIEKKYVWLILLAVAAVGLVIAYGGTNPQQMGHTIGEVEGLQQKLDDLNSKTGGVPALDHKNCEWIVVGGGWIDVVCPKGKFLAGMTHQTTKYNGGVRRIYCCNPY